MQEPKESPSGLTDLYLAALCQALALYETICGIVKIHRRRIVVTPPPSRELRGIAAQCGACGYVAEVRVEESPDNPDLLLATRMQEHINEHHPAAKPPPEEPDYAPAKDSDGAEAFQCRRCGAMRATEDAINAHLVTVHERRIS